MILHNIFLIIVIFFQFSFTQVTKIHREKIFLRSKRHVVFPEGSTYSVTASIVKAIMLQIPKGWNVLVECDAIFKLPTIKDYQKIKYAPQVNHHSRQRRDIFSEMEPLLSEFGLDGPACVKSMQCEAQLLAQNEVQTLAEELLIVVFTLPNTPMNENSFDECEKIYSKCKVPILHFLLQPMTYKNV